MIHRRPTRTLPTLDSIRDRGCTTVSACIVIECVPWRTALSEMVSDVEKLTGGFGPLRSTAGRTECLLDDMMVELWRTTKMSTSDNWWTGNPEADLVRLRTSLQAPGTGATGCMSNRWVWRLSNSDSVQIWGDFLCILFRQRCLDPFVGQIATIFTITAKR